MWPNAKRLYLDPPSDTPIDASQRAASNGLLAGVGQCRVFVFGVFRPQSADRPKKFSGFPFPNTTKAQTQMEAPLVGVQGHQKQWENTKVLMEIDVFVCLVVQEPGVPGGLRPSPLPKPHAAHGGAGYSGLDLTSGGGAKWPTG